MSVREQEVFVVERLVPNLSAAMSGMVPVGAEILRIDKHETRGRSLKAVQEMLFGERGSLVRRRRREGSRKGSELEERQQQQQQQPGKQGDRSDRSRGKEAGGGMLVIDPFNRFGCNCGWSRKFLLSS
eukprot:768177-Hanusia_phi.AAC.7